MDRFQIEDIKDIHVGHLPAAKMGIIDSLLGEDVFKKNVDITQMASYKQGHQLGTEIENLLKGDQRDY